MIAAVDDLVWVRRMRGANLRKVESARVVGIYGTCVLPYRLRFQDGEENQFHGSELVDIKETYDADSVRQERRPARAMGRR